MHVPLAQHQDQLVLRERRGRRARARPCGRRGPTPRTRGTPTVGHRDRRRGCTGAPTRGCGRARARPAAAAAPGRPRATRPRRSDRTASTRAAPRTPGAPRGTPPSPRAGRCARRRTRPPRGSAPRRSRRTRRRTPDAGERVGEREPQPHDHLATGRDLEPVVRRGLGALAARADRVLARRGSRSSWKASFTCGCGFARAEQPLDVRLVLGHEDRRRRAVERTRSAARSGPGPAARSRAGRRPSRGSRPWAAAAVIGPAPRPGVAEPERRQQVKRRGLGPAVRRGDPDQEIVGRRPWRTRRSTSK